MSGAGEVVHARVFVDRATVTRRVTVEASAGTQTLEIGPVPRELEADTLRARVRSPQGSLQVLGVGSQAAYADAPEGRRRETQRALDEVEAELGANEDAEDGDAHAMRQLTRYASIACDRISAEWLEGEPSFDRWSAVFDHLRGSHARLAEARAARARARLRLETRRAELVEALERIGRDAVIGQRISVTVEVPEDAAGPLEVELSYVTRQARWMPAYELRTDEGDEATLEMIALVRQTTGEDWQDIELLATTARPPLSEPPPELRKLTVTGIPGGADPDVVSTHVAGPRLSGAAAGPAAEPARVEHAAPGRLTVPSSGRPTRVELFRERVPVRRRLEAAPLTRPVAVWVLDVDNATGRVLLPGEVSLFRGSGYSGRSRIGFVRAKERFRVPLATEGSLRIARRTDAEPERSSGLAQNVAYEYATRIEVENVGPEPREIVIQDRVPISRHEAVRVERLRLPAGARVDEQTGRVELSAQIPPRERREYELAFCVMAPRGHRVEPPELL